MKVDIQKLGKVSMTCNGQWTDKEYDRLCLVHDGFYSSYISKKPVPAGIPLSNEEFWQPVASLNKDIIKDINKIIEDLISKGIFNTIIEDVKNYIKEYLSEYDFDEYINNYFNDPEFETKLLNLIDKYLGDNIEELINTYLTNNLENLIKEYFDENGDNILNQYFNTEEGINILKNIINDIISTTYIENIISQYFRSEAGEEFIKGLINELLVDIRTQLENHETRITELENNGGGSGSGDGFGDSDISIEADERIIELCDLAEIVKDTAGYNGEGDKAYWQPSWLSTGMYYSAEMLPVVTVDELHSLIDHIEARILKNNAAYFFFKHKDEQSADKYLHRTGQFLESYRRVDTEDDLPEITDEFLEGAVTTASIYKYLRAATVRVGRYYYVLCVYQKSTYQLILNETDDKYYFEHLKDENPKGEVYKIRRIETGYGTMDEIFHDKAYLPHLS